MADMSPDMIEGWRGVMFTNAGGDTLVVYSDIGNDGVKSLFDEYTYERPTETLPGRYEVKIAADAETETANMISIEDVRRPDDDTALAGTPAEPRVTFEGSVRGIDGTFTCTGSITVCVAPVRFSDNTVATGVLMGGWFFIPDEGASLYTDDTSYLTFGWWLDKDAGGNPVNLRLVSAATTTLGEARAATNTLGSAITGSATYKGAAAGKYAMASTTADTYEGGHFTAMATITADFDAESDQTDGNRNGVDLSGMIDNFMTGDTSRPDWSVKLMMDFNPDLIGLQIPDALIPTDNVGTTMNTEWSTGAAAKGTGEWTATWHDGETPAREAMHPVAVSGMFNAHIGSAASLQGAFGANKMDE